MDDSTDDKESGNPLATVLSGGMLVSGSKVIALGFGFLTQIVMARLLTESAYGDVVLALAVVGVGTLVATLGLDDGLMREFPKYEDDTRKARGVARAGLVISVVAGAIVGTAVFFASPLFASWVFRDPSLTSLIRIAALGIPFMVLKNNSVALARGARDAKPHAIVDQLVQPAARVLLIGGLVLAGFEAAGAVTGQIGAIFLASVLAVYLAMRLLPSLRGPSVPMYRSVLAFSLPLIAVQGMGLLNSQLDVYILGYFLASARVGVYNIALQLGNLLVAVLATVAFLLPPVLTRLKKEDRQGEMLATYQGLTKWMVLLALPVFTVLFFAPKLVINLLFGESYTDGYVTLRILLLGNLFGILAGLNTNALIAMGEGRLVSYTVFVQVLVNFSMNLTLIPIFGIEGAAIALAGATVVGDTLGSVLLYKRYRLHPISSSVMLPFGLLSVFAGIGYTIAWYFAIPTWAVIVLIGLGYPIITVRYALEPQDEELLSLFESKADIELPYIRDIIRVMNGYTIFK